MATKAKNELTPKHKRFCEEYLIDLNGKQAAIRCGYAENSAIVQASRMLTYANVQEYLKTRQDKLSKDLEITPQMVLKELYKVGFSNIQDYIKEGFTIEEIKSLKKEHAAAISEISTETTTYEESSVTKVKFKLHDKLSALDKIAKHLGLYEKNNTITVKQEQPLLPDSLDDQN